MLPSILLMLCQSLLPSCLLAWQFCSVAEPCSVCIVSPCSRPDGILDVVCLLGGLLSVAYFRGCLPLAQWGSGASMADAVSSSGQHNPFTPNDYFSTFASLLLILCIVSSQCATTAKILIGTAPVFHWCVL